AKPDYDALAAAGTDILPPGGHHVGKDGVFTRAQVRHPGAALVDGMCCGAEAQPVQHPWPDGIALLDVRLRADEEAAAPPRLTLAGGDEEGQRGRGGIVADRAARRVEEGCAQASSLAAHQEQRSDELTVLQHADAQ